MHPTPSSVARENSYYFSIQCGQTARASLQSGRRVQTPDEKDAKKKIKAEDQCSRLISTFTTAPINHFCLN